MNDIPFNPEQIYDVSLRYSSLKLFREGVGKYTDKIKKWQKPGNIKVEEILDQNERLSNWLDENYNKSENKWHISFYQLSGKTLQILKSTLPLLLKALRDERNIRENEGAPDIAFEDIDEKIKQIEELMNMRGIKEIPILDLLKPSKKNIPINKDTNLEYDVALSFASEQRDYVDKVASGLKENGIKVFYDNHEEINLWGEDLAEHLDTVYRKKSKYVVAFVSKAYKNKSWPKHEFRSALAKAVEQKGGYILPVKFDDTDLPGLQPSIKYISSLKVSPDTLVEMIIKKIRK